ncbi:DUF1365 domain-containing protein [Sedimentitalea nanhaiensis]|uniref:Cyclopropane-fatty-acyl-phospholipid synthase n=1 Tax=Sedimentitalea nanhaiensis TaxID=999627 RepID=A0A1I7C4T9_9RHOB|nr:DUF1365 domain-containing protein [Sedimentitalea nanhaiensis]SFT94432.1 hypothetical protein SAMN05216236_11462 [Sedimentitalea nanhaiensis]
MMLEHVQAQTHHARRGALRHAFTYGVDYVLSDLGDAAPWLISRNRFNLWSIWDRHHGGPRGDGRGVGWFREVLLRRGFAQEGAQLLLLTQPSFLWFHFNPVSFWIAMVDGRPRAFVAEVNNTFGHRHCYFCAHEDFGPIAKGDRLVSEKMMHVSPFQSVNGQYHFDFGIDETEIDIRISYKNGDQGVVATLSGSRRPASSRSLLWAALRRPLGALRVLGLIHFEAVILFAKRAPFLKRQPAPELLISDSQNFVSADK